MRLRRAKVILLSGQRRLDLDLLTQLWGEPAASRWPVSPSLGFQWVTVGQVLGGLGGEGLQLFLQEASTRRRASLPTRRCGDPSWGPAGTGEIWVGVRDRQTHREECELTQHTPHARHVVQQPPRRG